MIQPHPQPYSTIHSKRPLFTLVWVVLGSQYIAAWIGEDLGSDEGGNWFVAGLCGEARRRLSSILAMWGFLDGRECKEIGAVLSRSYITSIDGAVLVLRMEKLLHQSEIDIRVCNSAMWKGEGKANWMWRHRGRKSTIVGTCEGGVRIGNGASISLRNALTSLSLNTSSPPWSCSSSNTHYHPNTSHLPTIRWNPRGGKFLKSGR